MPGISVVEDAIKDRLMAEIAGVEALKKSVPKPDGSTADVRVQVKSYPKKPTETLLKTLAAAGAVLVRFAGSKYGKIREAGTRQVQDRTMFFEVLTVDDSLRAEDAHGGIYELLDLCGERLMGFTPAGCTSGIELVSDEYLSENNGAWEYGILTSVKAQKVREVS